MYCESAPWPCARPSSRPIAPTDHGLGDLTIPAAPMAAAAGARPPWKRGCEAGPALGLTAPILMAGECDRIEAGRVERLVMVEAEPMARSMGQVAAAHLLGACAERGRDAGGGAHGADLGREARLGREGGPAEPGPRAGIGSMGKTSPDASGDAPGSRPLSFSRRRLAGGGCAEREPAVLPVEGLGLHCTGKGRPRAGGTRDRPRGEREGGARSGA